MRRTRPGLVAGALLGVAAVGGVTWWAGAGTEVARAITRRTRLSPHLQAWEVVVSAKADELGLDNWPTDEVIWRRLRMLANEGFEPIRALHGGPLRVNSAYRTPEVNRAVGGSPTSDHMTGRAMDFEPVSGSAEVLFHRIRSSGLLEQLPIDQLIYYPERGHIHMGVRSNPRRIAGLSFEGAPVQWLS